MSLRNPTVPLNRAWNTWSSFPAEMVFLPLGVRLTPVAYSDRLRRASRFPAGLETRFGRHGADGGCIELDLAHGDTALTLSYMKPGPFEVVGAWRTNRLGEWGLRFWVNLCLSTEASSIVSYDPDARAAIARVGTRFVALVSADDPVQVTGHETIDALISEYEARGYFHRASRRTQAAVIVLRFNLEMTRQGHFAMAVADRAEFAVSQAKRILAGDPLPKTVPTQTGRFAGALEAVEDVVGWNTVYDEVNQRAYTSISRNWNLHKFGGFGVWLNDQQYAAHMSALFDPQMGIENLSVALANATPDGNFACLVTAEDAWVDRNQLPLGALLVWLMYLRLGSRTLLLQSFDALVRNHAWWWRSRDPLRRGLVSFGTSDVGDGLYGGTSFAARNESSMDNAPIHDEATYDPQTRTLTSEDVGLNSLLALDAEMLALMAVELGHSEQAAALRRSAAGVCERIRDQLWDDRRRLFANRLRSGGFVRSVGPTSFYPLICGAATPDQAWHLLAHLANRETFGGRFVIPSVSRDDPAFADNCYWRGRIWPPLNFLVWNGLRRYGFDAEARRLAEASFDLFRANWDGQRLSPENFNAVTGEALDQPDTEGFYTWGALMPLLGVNEVMDVTPWRGWEISHDGGDSRLGPIESPIGSIVIVLAAAGWEIWKGQVLMLRSNIVGRFSHMRWRDGRIDMELPASLASDACLEFPALAAEEATMCRFGEMRIEPQRGQDGHIIITGLPRLPHRQTLTLMHE
jgi:putative isomerase